MRMVENASGRWRDLDLYLHRASDAPGTSYDVAVIDCRSIQGVCHAWVVHIHSALGKIYMG